jgi:hypothetical protein
MGIDISCSGLMLGLKKGVGSSGQVGMRLFQKKSERIKKAPTIFVVGASDKSLVV